MKRIGETNFFRHLLHQYAGLLNPGGGMIHLEAQQELIGALLIVTSEQTTEIGLVDMALGGDLFECSEYEKIAFDILAALLIAGERQSFRPPQWGTGVHYLARQTFQQHDAEFGIASTEAKSTLDEFVEKWGQSTGREDTRHTPEREFA